MTGASVFGRELRRLRQDAGLSLAQLAALTHFSRGHLSKVEVGRRRATEPVARRCDDALHARGTLLTIACGAAQRSDGGPATNPDLVTRTVAPIQRVVAGDLDELDETFRAIFVHLRRLGRQVAAGIVLSALDGPYQALAHLVAGGPPGAERLAPLAARYAEFAGWMAQEDGDDARATAWTCRAMELASGCGERDLMAQGWVRRAEIALYRKDAAGVLEAAARARSAGAASPGAAAWALRVEAQGYALAGDLAACRTALDRADRMPSEPLNEFAFGSVTVGDPNAAVAGWCEVDLKRPGDAALNLERALEAIPTQSRRARGLYSARLCLAQVAAGEPELAIKAGAEALDHFSHTNSATIGSQLRLVARILPRRTSSPGVTEFRTAVGIALQPASHNRAVTHESL